MLSKVLAAKNAAGVKAAVFPAVGREIQRITERPDGAEGDAALLANQVRSLESQLAAARRESFESGRMEGERQARSELQPMIERLNTSIGELASVRQDLRRGAERDVVRLALLIAQRVLHRELSVDENALNAIARVAFDRLARSESYTVTVHPRFAEAIRQALPATQASRVHIESDPSCAPGTLVFHSTEGVIDASVETQLDEIGRGLADRLELAS